MALYKIVEEKKSEYHIVGSNNSTECERFAASELQKYIYQSTDTCIPYFSDKCPKRGKEIIIGADTRKSKDTYGVKGLEQLGQEGFMIKTLGDDILITGNTPRGTLYGVYAFLEKFLGFRAFTKDVEKIDLTESLILADIDIREIPDFEYRDAYFRFAFDGGFCSKNKLNTTLGDLSREKGGSFKFYNFHHSFDDLVPSELYFAEHPEYYSEIDGVRKTTQLCLSNPEVLEIATAKVLKWIQENPHCKVFSVAQNDEVTNNPKYCTCEHCRRIDEQEGSPAGSIIHFVNKIAERIESKHPDVLLHTFAFAYSRKAPRFVRARKNVIVRLCNIECEWGRSFEETAKKNPEGKCAEFIQNIREWTAICDRVYIWDYAVNFANYLQPFPIFYQIAENIKLFKRYGVKGVLEQGNFSYGGGAAMDDLKAYLIAKLLWNADADVKKVVNEFVEGVYGKGAVYIKEYLNLISDAVKGHTMTLYDYPDCSYITEEIIEKADALFRQAEDAESGECKKRIEREHLSIEYLKTARIEEVERRSEAIDEFATKVKEFKLTELMERCNLYDSFEIMKRGNYTKNRSGSYCLYYIVR